MCVFRGMNDAPKGSLGFAPFVSEACPIKRFGGGPAFKDQVIFCLCGPFEFEGERKCPQVDEWLDLRNGSFRQPFRGIDIVDPHGVVGKP